MENEELKELYGLKNRLLTLEKIAQSYKDNPKGLKLCLKFIKLEVKTLNKCTSINTVDLRELQRTYSDLTEILQNLAKKSAKAVTDLQVLTEKTEKQVNELNEQLNPFSENVRKIASSIDGAAQKLSAKLESGAQMLGDAINGTVEEIKKRFANEE